MAAEVFAERGFRQTDVQVIADRLGVGKGTVYRYFPSKEQLFLAAVDRGVQRLQTAVREAADALSDPLDQIDAAVHGYLSFFDRHPELVELIIQERAEFRDRRKHTYFAHRDANIGRWRTLFKQLVDQGRLRDVPVTRLTDVLSDLLYGTIFTNHFANRRRSFKSQARDVIDVTFHGILSPDEQTRRPAKRASSRRPR